MHLIDEDWVGLCAVTESNQPHEWPALMWVLRNRMHHPHKWSDEAQEVVLQPRQFSYFNQFSRVDMSPEQIYEAALADHHRVGGLVPYATGLASWVFMLGDEHDPTRGSDHFWSPRSMQPWGASPTWSRSLDWTAVPGIDPKRFLFARPARQ